MTSYRGQTHFHLVVCISVKETKQKYHENQNYPLLACPSHHFPYNRRKANLVGSYLSEGNEGGHIIICGAESSWHG